MIDMIQLEENSRLSVNNRFYQITDIFLSLEAKIKVKFRTLLEKKNKYIAKLKHKINSDIVYVLSKQKSYNYWLQSTE